MGGGGADGVWLGEQEWVVREGGVARIAAISLKEQVDGFSAVFYSVGLSVDASQEFKKSKTKKTDR